jgi:hypothetical protein
MERTTTDLPDADAGTIPPAPKLEFAFVTTAAVGPLVDLGDTAHGRRRIVPILGGTFDGPGLKGVVRGGSDWQIVRADGVLEIEASYYLEADDGALITIVNRGVRRATPEVMERLNRGEIVAPDEVYFRTAPRFETSAPAYQWMTSTTFVGVGERRATEVIINFWKVM